MGGFFGVVSKKDCVNDLFFGTDYHSHLGTKRGGMAVQSPTGEIKRHIHDITNAQFRSKFEHDVTALKGGAGIGVISDFEDQPLIVGSHLGTYAIVTVGRINNADELIKKAFKQRITHFSEMSNSAVNPTEIIATLINKGSSIEEGIEMAFKEIDGSCSILLMSENKIYAARDRYGRTPIILGKKDGAHAATMETTAFPNLGYQIERYMGPGEIVLISPDGVEQKKAPGNKMRICSFLWIYYGYPSSCYEGITVENVRHNCGAMLAENDEIRPDIVAGIPDSGTAHAIGYANRSGVPYGRPFVKYTPTWPRSFMPQDQSVRDLVANMKLIPVKEQINGKRILFCDDSIVRGTQLKDTVKRLHECGAKEVHMRSACPPLVCGCKYLNFSRSRSDMDLAARRAIQELEKTEEVNPLEYADPKSEKYRAMVEKIRKRLNLTTLKYQKIEDLVKAIGIPREKLCTYCWDGRE